MTILTTILSPPFLANNVRGIALTLGAVTLIFFGDIVMGRLVIPVGDWLKIKSTELMQKQKRVKVHAKITRYLPQSLATLIFVAYCYLGVAVLAEYLYEPILQNMKDVIILPVLALFVILNYIINNKKLRNKLISVGNNKK